MNALYLSLLKYVLTHILGTSKGNHAYDLVTNVVIPAVEATDPAALAELDKLTDGKVTV